MATPFPPRGSRANELDKRKEVECKGKEQLKNGCYLQAWFDKNKEEYKRLEQARYDLEKLRDEYEAPLVAYSTSKGIDSDVLVTKNEEPH